MRKLGKTLPFKKIYEKYGISIFLYVRILFYWKLPFNFSTSLPLFSCSNLRSLHSLCLFARDTDDLVSSSFISSNIWIDGPYGVSNSYYKLHVQFPHHKARLQKMRFWALSHGIFSSKINGSKLLWFPLLASLPTFCFPGLLLVQPSFR